MIRQAAETLHDCGRDTLIVDCNAVAPATIAEMASALTSAGGRSGAEVLDALAQQHRSCAKGGRPRASED